MIPRSRPKFSGFLYIHARKLFQNLALYNLLPPHGVSVTLQFPKCIISESELFNHKLVLTSHAEKMNFSGTAQSYLCSWFVGYGGGFNERVGVEYIQRQDSDDEFDEVTFNFLNLLKGCLIGAWTN